MASTGADADHMVEVLHAPGNGGVVLRSITELATAIRTPTRDRSVGEDREDVTFACGQRDSRT